MPQPVPTAVPVTAPDPVVPDAPAPHRRTSGPAVVVRLAGALLAALGGLVVGTAGLLAHAVVVRVPLGSADVALPVGLAVGVLAVAAATAAVVAASRTPWPRFALAAGWLAAVAAGGLGGRGSDLLLRDDLRGTLFLVGGALALSVVALLVPRWLR